MLLGMCPGTLVVMAGVLPGLCVGSLSVRCYGHFFLGACTAWLGPGCAVWPMLVLARAPGTDGNFPACLWLGMQVSTASWPSM